MFGYVVADRNALTPEQQRRYQGYYCGVCHSLGALHGPVSRLLLSYDMAFLAMLLSGLYEEAQTTENVRCLLHPTKHHDQIQSRYVDYAADMCIALAYYNLLDNWSDERSLPSFALSGLMRSRFEEVSRRYPRQCVAMKEHLQKLRELEQAREPSPERAADQFGQLLGAVFVYEPDIWRDTLYETGVYLGRFIYLMDAYEDLPRDTRRGSYNPLIPYAEHPEHEALFKQLLTVQIANCAAAFERLPIIQDCDILRNILYSGVWSKYYAMQKKQTEGEAPHE